jgi:hypothetical protein
LYQGDLGRDVAGASVRRKTDADVEEDIDVDEDDDEFGVVQFDEGELDVYRNSTEKGMILIYFMK